MSAFYALQLLRGALGEKMAVNVLGSLRSQVKVFVLSTSFRFLLYIQALSDMNISGKWGSLRGC